MIPAAAGTAVAALGLTQVWKYRRRLYFIQGGTMDAWYLDIDAVAGTLQPIPLSGAFTKGGSLLFGCAWSVSAGDGIDDKCIFVTTEGEIAVFTGTNPGDVLNWRQQGRYQMSPPMGKNCMAQHWRRRPDHHGGWHRASKPGAGEGYRGAGVLRADAADPSAVGRGDPRQERPPLEHVQVGRIRRLVRHYAGWLHW